MEREWAGPDRWSEARDLRKQPYTEGGTGQGWSGTVPVWRSW
jgi:hypothetical protein